MKRLFDIVLSLLMLIIFFLPNVAYSTTYYAYIRRESIFIIQIELGVINNIFQNAKI